MPKPTGALSLAALALTAAMMLALAARAQNAATPAEAANGLVAAIAKNDIAAAAAYVAASDRDRFVSLIQASTQLASARDGFRKSVAAKLPANRAAAALLARTAPRHIDHIDIVAQRAVGRDEVDLDVKGFGSQGGSSAAPSTWRAVRENGQWRIHLPPCASAQAVAPLMKRYQDLIAATNGVTTAVESGKIATFGDAHIALFKAELGVLGAQGEQQ
jgi:hypothetical protein